MMPALKHNRKSGFTLVEMAVVIVIVGLIIGGLVTPLAMQMELRSRQETKKSLETIKEALIGFALTNGRLPCPDFNGDGIEDRSAPAAVDDWDAVDTNPPVDEIRRPTQACADATPTNLYQGWLPFVSIGVGRSDDWSDRFTYRVSPEFSDDFNVWADNNAANGTLDGAEIAAAAIRTNTSLASKGDILIGERGDDAVTAGLETKSINSLIGTLAAPSTANAAAVIISHGKNQRSAFDAFSGVARPAAPANTDELLNATDGIQKITRTPTPVSAACSETAEGSPYCEFDDMVDWITPTVLLNRMVSAGKLP